MEEPTDQDLREVRQADGDQVGAAREVYRLCTGYPDCTNTRELPVADTGEVSEQDEAEMCDNCGRPMVLKRAVSGSFSWRAADIRIARRPQQLGAAQQQKDVPLEEKCPNCGNHLIKKFGRYGEVCGVQQLSGPAKFVKQKTIGVEVSKLQRGRSGGAAVEAREDVLWVQPVSGLRDFVAWGKPIAEKCPQCGGSYMIEKVPEGRGAFAQCPNDECKFKKPGLRLRLRLRLSFKMAAEKNAA